MIIFLRLFAIILALISISKSFLDYRKRQEPLVMFIFWTVVWIVATAIAVYPLLIEKLLIYSQDSSVTVGSLITVAFVFLLFIIYRVYAKAARIETQLTELVRKISLDSTPLADTKK